MHSTNQPLLWDTERAAKEIWGAGKAARAGARKLQVFRQQGGGPRYVKMGRNVYYHPKAVIEWIEEQMVKSSADARAKNKFL